MFFGSQILIFFAVGLQIRQNISLAVSLQFCSNKTNVPADLHELLSAAKNLPEYSIRIFNPLASYCYLIGMNCGSQIPMLPALYSKKAFGFNSFNYSNFFNSLINNS